MSEIRDDETTSDPPGLGGLPAPDAASRRPRPKIVSLLAEFFRMSRTTAILLGAFIVISVLYAVVKDEPVVGIGNPAPESSSVETEPAEPSTSAPDSSTSVTETTVPTSTDATTSQLSETTETSDSARVDRGQTPTTVPGRPGATATQPPAQGQPQQGQSQQQAPDGGTAAPPEGGQTVR